MKHCTNCGEQKPLDLFRKRSKRSGYTSRCKACLHKIERARAKQQRSMRRVCIYCKVLIGGILLQRICSACLPYTNSRGVFNQLVLHLAETQDEHLLNEHKAFLMQSQSRLKAAALHILNLLGAQDFKCAVCRSTLTRDGPTRLCVDHCHETQEVRAILCTSCNTALGMIHDNYSIAVRLSQYVKKHT